MNWINSFELSTENIVFGLLYYPLYARWMSEKYKLYVLNFKLRLIAIRTLTTKRLFQFDSYIFASNTPTLAHNVCKQLFN